MSSTIAAIGVSGERLVSIGDLSNRPLPRNKGPNPEQSTRQLDRSVRARPSTYQQSRKAAYNDAIVMLPPGYNCLQGMEVFVSGGSLARCNYFCSSLAL